MNELVDVVDENDEIIGVKPRDECHKNGLLHRLSCILLFDSKGRIWLQKRAKGRLGSGKLDFSASGHVSGGEDYEIAAYREMEEEIGVKAKLARTLSLMIVKNVTEGNIMAHMMCIFTGISDGPFNLQDAELESIKAYDLDDIEMIIYDGATPIASGLKKGIIEYLKSARQ